MPDDTPEMGPKVGPKSGFLAHRYGPLPAWGWGVAGIGGIGIWYILRRRGMATSAGPADSGLAPLTLPSLSGAPSNTSMGPPPGGTGAAATGSVPATSAPTGSSTTVLILPSPAAPAPPAPAPIPPPDFTHVGDHNGPSPTGLVDAVALANVGIGQPGYQGLYWLTNRLQAMGLHPPTP